MCERSDWIYNTRRRFHKLYCSKCMKLLIEYRTISNIRHGLSRIANLIVGYALRLIFVGFIRAF